MSNKFNEWQEQIQNANGVVRALGNLTSDVIDSLAEFGAFIPLAEIVVTIAVYSAAGLGEFYGLEVLAGLVFAQVAALYLAAHYRDTAMHPIGQGAIFLSVMVGAVNTATAVFMAMIHGEGAAWVSYVPAFSSGIAVLLMYTAKLFTAARVHSRKRLSAVAANELAELNRQGAAQRQEAGLLDDMQNTRLQMQADALKDLAADGRIRSIQRRAMYQTVVKGILDNYSIHPNSALGKELLHLAREAAHGGSVDVPQLDPEVWGDGSTNGSPSDNPIAAYDDLQALVDALVSERLTQERAAMVQSVHAETNGNGANFTNRPGGRTL